MTRRAITFMLAGLLILAAGAAWAQSGGPYADIDYYGFAWETGGFPPSDLGDVLTFTGVATNVDPIFGVDLSDFELTFYMYDMTNCGEETQPSGWTKYYYCGGYLEVYLDAAQDADWGVFPPNTTSPSSFANGILFFMGPFTEFTLTMSGVGYGSYQGLLDGEDGWLINEVCSDCAFTWGGSFSDAFAQIPDGYDLQWDGKLQMDIAVPNEASTWSSVKALYR